MDVLQQITGNKAVAVPVIVWMLAQVLKVLWGYIWDKRFRLRRMVETGGMPSSHSTFVSALAVVIGKNYGWDSGVFAVAAAIAFIVMFDAAGIRRAAGKHAQILNRLINTQNGIHLEEKLRELLGHTPVEVIAGALLGTTGGLVLG